MKAERKFISEYLAERRTKNLFNVKERKIKLNGGTGILQSVLRNNYVPHLDVEGKTFKNNLEALVSLAGKKQSEGYYITALVNAKRTLPEECFPAETVLNLLNKGMRYSHGMLDYIIIEDDGSHPYESVMKKYPECFWFSPFSLTDYFVSWTKKKFPGNGNGEHFKHPYNGGFGYLTAVPVDEFRITSSFGFIGDIDSDFGQFIYYGIDHLNSNFVDRDLCKNLVKITKSEIKAVNDYLKEKRGLSYRSFSGKDLRSFLNELRA